MVLDNYIELISESLQETCNYCPSPGVIVDYIVLSLPQGCWLHFRPEGVERDLIVEIVKERLHGMKLRIFRKLSLKNLDNIFRITENLFSNQI